MNKWIIDEPTLLHIMSVAIGAAYVSVEDASKRLGVTAPILQAATRDAQCDAISDTAILHIADEVLPINKGPSHGQIIEVVRRCIAASAPKGDGND